MKKNAKWPKRTPEKREEDFGSSLQRASQNNSGRREKATQGETGLLNGMKENQAFTRTAANSHGHLALLHTVCHSRAEDFAAVRCDGTYDLVLISKPLIELGKK